MNFRPPQAQHHFSIETLMGVLRKATQKRKYIRDEKTQDKLDLRSKEEASRSNSQASDAPSKLAMLPAQSSTGEGQYTCRKIDNCICVYFRLSEKCEIIVVLNSLQEQSDLDLHFV